MTPTDLLPIPGFADPISSLSHLIGAFVFAALGEPLLRKGRRMRTLPDDRAPAGRCVSLAIFAVSAVLLLSFSGIFHLMPREAPARQVLQRLDHAAIFLLIAGTATPVHAILCRGVWRWGMLSLIWTLALVGVTLKSVYFASMPQSLGLGLYVGMGWVSVISLGAIARGCGIRRTFPIIIGGVVYTLGAALELANPRPLITGVVRSHELFHVAVLIGLALHWRFIWSIADVDPTGDEAPPILECVIPQRTALSQEEKRGF